MDHLIKDLTGKKQVKVKTVFFLTVENEQNDSYFFSLCSDCQNKCYHRILHPKISLNKILPEMFSDPARLPSAGAVGATVVEKLTFLREANVS